MCNLWTHSCTCTGTAKHAAVSYTSGVQIPPSSGARHRAVIQPGGSPTETGSPREHRGHGPCLPNRLQGLLSAASRSNGRSPLKPRRYLTDTLMGTVATGRPFRSSHGDPGHPNHSHWTLPCHDGEGLPT